MDEARIQENFSWERMELIRLAMANDQVVLAENKRREKIKWSVTLALVGGILFIVGSFMGEASGNPDSSWHLVAIVGFFPPMAIAFLWGGESDTTAAIDKPKKKNRRRFRS